MRSKRIIFLILTFAMLLSLLCLPTAAADNELYIAPDYSYVSFNGVKYIRIDTDDVSYIQTNRRIYEMELGILKDEIDMVYANANDTFIELDVYYIKGGYGNYVYIKESMLQSYNKLLIEGGDPYNISATFGTVSVTRDKMFSKELLMRGYELNYYTKAGNVTTLGMNGDISIECGYVFYDNNGSFYYFDYHRSTGGIAYTGSTEMLDSVTVFEITDEDTIAELMENIPSDSINPDEFPDGEDDIPVGDSTEGGLIVGIFLLIFVFASLPFIAGLVTFILSFKASGEYKLHLRIISAVCAAAVITIFLTILVCIMLTI